MNRVFRYLSKKIHQEQINEILRKTEEDSNGSLDPEDESDAIVRRRRHLYRHGLVETSGEPPRETRSRP